MIARFMPILRTFAPVVAGAAEMTYRRFATYNVLGGIGWVTSMTLTGYFLGLAVPDLEKHIHLVVAVGDLPLAPARHHRVAADKDAGPARGGSSRRRGVGGGIVSFGSAAGSSGR